MKLKDFLEDIGINGLFLLVVIGDIVSRPAKWLSRITGLPLDKSAHALIGCWAYLLCFPVFLLFGSDPWAAHWHAFFGVALVGTLKEFSDQYLKTGQADPLDAIITVGGAVPPALLTMLVLFILQTI